MAMPLKAIAGRRGRYKKSLHIIPFFFTFANAFFGFLSVIEAVQGDIIKAASCIGLAALADACDGRVARVLGVSSCLGVELDSLCDAISFCFAPVILLYSLYQDTMSYSGIFILGIYLCAGLFRLARFNVTSSAQYAYFKGLSVPVAAFFLASLSLYYEGLSQSALSFLVDQRAVFMLVLALSLLMVSSIPFPSGKGLRRSFYLPAGLCFSIYMLICWVYHLPTLVILLAGYIVCSLAAWLLRTRFLHDIL